MPTYEYACDRCESEFEVEQRITEDPIKTCPRCRSRRVRRLISQTSFVLKGGGWYSDLYSSGAKARKSGSSEGSSSSGDSKESSSKDSSSKESSSKESSSSDKSSSGSSGKSESKGTKAVA